MKRYFVYSLLLVTALILCTHELKAATLYGKVIEINDGDAITLLCMKRPVRIQLLGVDAPEQAQPFGDLAKRHLSDLIMDRMVVVEYAGIGTNGSINGKVLLEGADIGAQMIRDGAAWVDPKSQNRLAEIDRQIYTKSEEAARNEKRGLWETPNPVAPWDFVKAQEAKMNPTAAVSQSASLKKPTVTRSTGSLDNLTLMNFSPAPRNGNPDMNFKLEDLGPEHQTWEPFRPHGQNFSVVMPSDGKRVSQTVPLPGVEPVTVDLKLARDGTTLYAVIWISGPTGGEADVDALQLTTRGILKSIGQGIERSGGDFSCEPQDGRNISTAGYVGRSYDWSNCSLPSKAAAYTKVVGDRREMYMVMVIYREDDPNIARFLKSFTVGTHKAAAAKQ